MKLAKTRIAVGLVLTIVLAILVATSSGCGVINRIRSKNQLNEAAKAYREGNFVEAEQHSRQAAELDPNNKTAPMFIARTIHAQYRPGVQTPENIAKAQEAIQAYQAILDRNPADDEAYKAIAYLYGAIKDNDKPTAATANRPCGDSHKRARPPAPKPTTCMPPTARFMADRARMNDSSGTISRTITHLAPENIAFTA